MIAVNITMILDCEPEEVADAVNESIRPISASHSPGSIIVDYAIGTAVEVPGFATDYEEGEAFLKP